VRLTRARKPLLTSSGEGRLATEIESRYPSDLAFYAAFMKLFAAEDPKRWADIPEHLLMDATVDGEHLRLIRELGLL
jgi:hypothetical protein